MNQDEINWRYCQSCGMPLFSECDDYLGTNVDGSHSETFCHCCFKDGAYTADVKMSEMIKMWVEYTDAYNDYAGTNYSPKELKIVLERRVPTLSRWKQKFETHNIHYRSIQKILTHIYQHLFEDIDIKALSSVGGLSESHLRRVFQTATGETVATYIQRLRLEQIANLLLFTDYTLDQIVRRTNYNTKNALAKAFRKHFGITTSLYRKRYKTSEVTSTCKIIPEIKIIKEMCVLYVEVGDSYKVEKEYRRKWKRLIEYAQQNQLSDKYGKFISISLDDPLITTHDKCRFYMGVTVPENTKPKMRTGVFHIPQQQCAIFKHKGDYDSMIELYKAIYENWLPYSGYTPSGTMTFEVYVKNPFDTPFEELVTEVFVPIGNK